MERACGEMPLLLRRVRIGLAGLTLLLWGWCSGQNEAGRHRTLMAAWMAPVSLHRAGLTCRPHSRAASIRQGPAHVTGVMPQVWAALQAAQQVCDMSCQEPRP